MAAAETADEDRRAISWLTAAVLLFLAALIGLLTAFAKDNETAIVVLFALFLLPAVLILPAWAVWGLGPDEDHEE